MSYFLLFESQTIWWTLQILSFHLIWSTVESKKKLSCGSWRQWHQLVSLRRWACVFCHPWRIVQLCKLILAWIWNKSLWGREDSDGWTVERLQCTLPIRRISQWNSTYRTCWMLFQPYVYASDMECMPTKRKNAQNILLLVFCETNCAPNQKQQDGSSSQRWMLWYSFEIIIIWNMQTYHTENKWFSKGDKHFTLKNQQREGDLRESNLVERHE